MKEYSAALFDMDGTLLDSMGYWHNIVAEWAELLLGKDLPGEERSFLEDTSCSRGLQFVQDKYAALKEEKGWEGIFRLLDRHYREDVLPRPGARQLLKELRAEGLPMGIITGTPHALTDTALETAGFAGYFDFILSPDEFPAGKKEPEIFREGLRRLGEPVPEQVLFFEDQLYSIRTARELGLYIIALREPYAIKDEEEIRRLSDEYWESPEDFRSRS